MENTLPHQKTNINNQNRETLFLGICLLCLFLFLYTASSKLIDHQLFLKGLNKIEIIKPFAFVISWVVPVLEILVAIMLLIPSLVRLGLYSFLVLMSAFTVYIICLLLWVKKLPCSCGGVIAQLSWEQHVWFNLAFISLAILGLRLSNFRHKN